jgi:hypothetical protein
LVKETTTLDNLSDEESTEDEKSSGANSLKNSPIGPRKAISTMAVGSPLQDSPPKIRDIRRTTKFYAVKILSKSSLIKAK